MPGTAAHPAWGLSGWNYSTLPDGKDVQDSTWHTADEASAVVGVWTSEAPINAMTTGWVMGVVVAACVAAGAMLAAVFWPILGGPLGTCLIVWGVGSFVGAAVFGKIFHGQRVGRCDLRLAVGGEGAALEAAFKEAFAKGGAPIARTKPSWFITKLETRADKWLTGKRFHATYKPAALGKVGQLWINWSFGADPAVVRAVKGRVLEALRTFAPDPAQAVAAPNAPISDGVPPDPAETLLR